MYPPGEATTVEVRGPAEGWEGAARPGHFRGVATVCTKLFCQVGAEVAVFGEKDWQQLQVVRRVVRDLALPIRIAGVPTVREPDGLAMSSRNRFLAPAERALAPRLFAELRRAAEAIGAGAPVAESLAAGAGALQGQAFGVDYFAAGGGRDDAAARASRAIRRGAAWWRRRGSGPCGCSTTCPCRPGPISPASVAAARRAQLAASSASTCASTRVPFANCAGSEYSAGLWLMPLRLGTKIMPVGQSGTMNCASWKAPEGIRSVEKPCAAAARSTAPTTAGLNSTGCGDEALGHRDAAVAHRRADGRLDRVAALAQHRRRKGAGSRW